MRARPHCLQGGGGGTPAQRDGRVAGTPCRTAGGRGAGGCRSCGEGDLTEPGSCHGAAGAVRVVAFCKRRHRRTCANMTHDSCLACGAGAVLEELSEQGEGCMHKGQGVTQ